MDWRSRRSKTSSISPPSSTPAPAPDLPEVIPADVPVSDRAVFLARRTIASVTPPETHAAGHDGIAGLVAAFDRAQSAAGCSPYCEAVLR